MIDTKNRPSLLPRPSKRDARGLFAVAGLALLLAIVPGCSSDDDNPAAGLTGIPCLTFAPSEPQSSTVVAQVGQGTTCDVLVIDLMVTGDVNAPISDLFATNFALVFPTNLIRFAGATEMGSVLAMDLDRLELLQDLQPPYKVGLSIINASDGLDADIILTNKLIQLTFVRTTTSPGAGALSYDNPLLLDSGDPVNPMGPRPISGVMWFGGTVTVSLQ